MAFRMSSIQFMTNYQSSLNKTYQKQAKLLEQGDGSSIHRGSDDPVAYSKLLRHKVSANENDQYRKNVETAQAWMKTTDGVLTHIAEITKTFKEKTVEAATDTNNMADFDAIAKEMFAMIEEIYSVSKTQHGDRYIFSGQKDKTEPFVLSTDMYDRAQTKTLDAAQTAFFKGINNEGGGKVYQLLKLEDSDNGNIYYMDTDSGNIYKESFVNGDYKEYIARGYNTIDEIDTDTYSVKVTTASLDNDTADEAIKKLLTDATDSDSVVAKLTSFITSSHNDSAAILIKSAFADIAKDKVDPTGRISQILYDIGITDTDDNNEAVTAFQKFLEDYKCADYPALPAGIFFDGRGIPGDTDTSVIDLGSFRGNLKFMTEPQQIVKYNGDSNYISMVKLNGATDTAADVVNTVGQDLFGGDIFDDETSGYTHASGSSMINNMLQIYNKVKQGDVEWLISDGMTLADAANSTVVGAQTTMGARLQLYTSVEEMLANQSDNITEEITDVSGTDVAKMATDLMEMTTLYNMALALGGRVLPQSLADFL